MPQIALTFDDDPQVIVRNGVRLGTAELLRVIEDLSAKLDIPIKVTFFVVGVNIEKMLRNDISVIERMISGEHEIANHSYSHPYGFNKLPMDKALEEVRKNHFLIRDVFQQEPKYFRPPNGLIREDQKRMIVQQFPMYKIAGWDRHDEKDSYTASQLNNVVVRNARDKQVALLHVWYQNTLWGVRGIFNDLHQRDYRFVGMSDLGTIPSLNGLRDDVNARLIMSH
jgi:peptidoglycan-N-acetylglucosamine deacetylase